MKILRLLLVAVALMTAISTYAIEPSTQIVVVNGQKVYVHTVEKGHTLYSLAKVYGVTEKQIMACNDGLTAQTMRAGDVIYIPVIEPKAESPKREQRRQPADEAKYYEHIVEEGQTLYSIARNYKITVDIILADNPSIDPSRISIGEVLRIRRAEVGYATTKQIERAKSGAESLAADEHIVASGETVYSLSRRFKLSEKEFMRINNLSSAADLRAGMVVKCAVPAEQMPAEPAEVTPVVQPAVEEPAVEEPTVEEKSKDKGLLSYLGNLDIDNTTLNDIYDFVCGKLNIVGSEEVESPDIDFLHLGQNNMLKMVLMLPFKVEGKVKPGYVDFYRGVLFALAELKREGISVDLTVFDTQRNANVIYDIMASNEFLDAQLIVGPVFEGELRYVINHAEQENIPVVSPLADVQGLRSPVLFQMQPKKEHKYDKLADLLKGQREVITIYAKTNDTAFISEVGAEVGAEVSRRALNFKFDREPFFYQRNADGSNGAEVSIEDVLRSKTPKTIIIAADTDTDINRILATLSSVKSKLQDRGYNMGNYKVVGNYKWTRLETIDVHSLFKNNVAFVVSYHAKRSDEAVRLFDGKYAEAFDAMPTMFSYRGYDAVMIFCHKMYSGMNDSITSEYFKPLTTGYAFSYEDGIYVNTEWVREQYNDNFTITTH